ncbi:MAG: MBL fold metallo-hydrolase [Polyangiales bacterium]
MLFRQLFDKETSTYTYLVADPDSGQAALIDPVIEQLDRDLQLMGELGLELAYVLDTHVHADHVTASGLLRERTGARIVASRLGPACADVRVGHGDVVNVGSVAIEVLETPGHTDDSVSYRVGDDVFTGDALFVRGNGRTDFQNGDPEALYRSLTEVLLALPEHTRIWPGHDYRGHTMTTVGEEKRHNPRVAGKSRAEFVEVMNNLGLPRPKRLDEAVPANRECGCSEPEVHA